jgi:hypothetical protein
MKLTASQLALIESPLDAKVFLEGPAGAGKTTAGVERLVHLMQEGVRGDSILVLVPQRNLALPYSQALSNPGLLAGGRPDVLTLGGLSQKSIDLFWPLVGRDAGFSHPDDPPTFLKLETAQYYMARVVRPLREAGFFETAAIDPNRLYSQLLDTLNKAALVGFPHTEIGERLSSAWVGEASQLRLYNDVQQAANRFREYCLAHNLLDFSLQVEVFFQQLWPQPFCREYLSRTYRHLVYDNPEEDVPVTHDLVEGWFVDFDSALLIYDWDAGYRYFLGADPHSAYRLKNLCSAQVVFDDSLVTSKDLQAFAAGLGRALRRPPEVEVSPYASPSLNRVQLLGSTSPSQDGDLHAALDVEHRRFHPQVLDWVADQAADLVHDEGTPPGEIAILAPYMSDALRFALMERLERRGVPTRSHRPSRALRDEPAIRCLVTLAMIAHPDWEMAPARFDVAYALVQAVEDLDLVRAQLLAEIVYRPQKGRPQLTSFDRLQPDVQERITYLLGGRYENLRLWLEDYSLKPFDEIDYFFSRLFGEVLSQPGYGFHRDYDGGAAAANLIDSARRFRLVTQGARWVEDDPPKLGELPLGKEYLELVRDGVVAAQYLRGWEAGDSEALLLAPAYTFLVSNRSVDYQFWLDVGGRGWAERLYQPLTHPYVLSRRWAPGTPWTDVQELESSQEVLYRVALGLARRCRRKIYAGLSELGESGFEHRGALLMALQRLLRERPSHPLPSDLTS